MVTLRADQVSVSARNDVREFTAFGGVTQQLVTGGEVEITITCRIDMRDKARIAELQKLQGVPMELDLYASGERSPSTAQEFFEGKAINYGAPPEVIMNPDQPEASKGKVTW